MMSTLHNLHDLKRYEFQIHKNFNKIKNTYGIHTLFETKQKGIPFFSFEYDRHSLARILASAVRKQKYTLQAASQRLLKKPNAKERLLYHFCPTDKIVVGVITTLLTEILEPFLGTQIYSYRKNIRPQHALEKLSSYIKKQRSKHKVQGVYILNTDIQNYTDDINIQESSPLWNQLKEYFQQLNIVPTNYQWSLIVAAIRPEVVNLEGFLQSNIRGVPTGSPITSLLYNLFVASVDQVVMEEPDIFYSRYSDDIIICHYNLEVVKRAEIKLKKTLAQLKLTLSSKKTFRLYFSPAGNQGPDPSWKGANKIDLLGYCLDGSGTYTISTKRQRVFLRSIFDRIKNTIPLISSESLQKQGETLCRTINKAFIDSSMRHNGAFSMICESSDLSQLKHLDYCIALKIAESLSRRKGVRAFREISYRTIRDTWGLHSLVQLVMDKRS